MIKIIATGKNTGRSFKFRDWHFVNGVLALPGNGQQEEGVIRYLSRCLQAYPEGDPRIAQLNQAYGQRSVQTEAQPGKPAEVPGGVQSPGEGSAPLSSDVEPGADIPPTGSTQGVSEGDGPADSGDDTGTAEFRNKVIEAAKNLDHQNDEHWNQSGKPSVVAMQKLTGDATVTRKAIDTIIPDVVRNQ